MVCQNVLEEQGVLGDITLGDYAMDWIPYEDDLISMELDQGTWKDINLVGCADTNVWYLQMNSILVGRRPYSHLLCCSIAHETAVHIWSLSAHYWQGRCSSGRSYTV